VIQTWILGFKPSVGIEKDDAPLSPECWQQRKDCLQMSGPVLEDGIKDGHPNIGADTTDRSHVTKVGDASSEMLCA
jgi:hypothetical protein